MAIDATALMRECLHVCTYKLQTKKIQYFRDELWTQKFTSTLRTPANRKCFS